jgi:EAL domain-containing protein (putative c-di-GMP-specific phosphodiesterase class I)
MKFYKEISSNNSQEHLASNLLLNTHARSPHSIEDIALLICHELRTPLTSIQAVLGLLHTGKLDSLSEEGQQLLRIAISNAKRLGRLANAIERTPSLPATLLSRTEIEQLQLENDLHHALDRQQFEVVYQPIIAVDSYKTVGFEALLRWRHPSKGNISPTIFIPLAEQAGLIHHVGLWVLEQACHQLHLWQQQFACTPPLSMSVNLSALQLLQPDLLKDIKRILQQTNIAPGSLKLEITETTFIENQQLASHLLTELRQSEVQVYIDDFGTGYSSLARLQDFPIDALKIDRSFVQSKCWHISEIIILLASRLNLDVIAEGVETTEDLLMLQTMGCKQMQGYLFSEPVDIQTATRYLYVSCSQ